MISITLTRQTWIYDETKLLGKPGGFGRVYLGCGPGGEQVAVKVLKAEIGDAAARELEFAEGRAGKESKHLIPIFDAGIDAASKQACIVMALASESLRDRAMAKLPMDKDVALEIMAQIAAGLVEAGDWIHRDLKPENVLFADGRWQITDFGIGRIAEVTTDPLTLKGALSPPYAAPEQWQGVRATHATDIYALGCIGTELLTGARPFRGPSITDYERQHQSEPPTIGDVPPRVRGLLLAMLAKPANARLTADKAIAQIASIKAQGDNVGAGAKLLSAAAAVVVEQTAKVEAAEAVARADLAARKALEDHAISLLLVIADQLFDAISEQAPAAAIRKEKRAHVIVYEARLGQALLRITIGQYRDIPREIFSASEWDVICGDAILVSSANYQRSASLWFAAFGRKSEYNWIEMGYWTLGGGTDKIPTHLPPGREAALAASKILSNWRLANPIRKIDGDGLDTFCQRWMELFARAVEGTLAYPSTLPES